MNEQRECVNCGHIYLDTDAKDKLLDNTPHMSYQQVCPECECKKFYLIED